MNMLIHDTLAIEPTLINRKTSDPNKILENYSDRDKSIPENVYNFQPFYMGDIKKFNK